MAIRVYSNKDFDAVYDLINDAAQAYKGVIPDDCWREPYMLREELASEIKHGVAFWVATDDQVQTGVMGLQERGEVALIRHAYVQTALQGQGIGTSLLMHAQSIHRKPLLIGTWAPAIWAIEFYERNGFTVVSFADKEHLLRTYWDVPERQIATSIVLADRQWMEERPGAAQCSAGCPS